MVVAIPAAIRLTSGVGCDVLNQRLLSRARNAQRLRRPMRGKPAVEKEAQPAENQGSRVATLLFAGLPQKRLRVLLLCVSVVNYS